MSGRRHYSARRSTVPATSCVIGLISWVMIGDPFKLAGALIFLVLGAVLVPLLLVLAVFGVPYLLAGLWPRQYRRRYRKWRAHTAPSWLLRTRSQQKSSRIPAWLKRAVLAADRGMCVYPGCDAPWDKPQIDHVIPWSLGGLTALWNLMVLCAVHNRIKSNYWVSPSGKAYYQPFEDANNEPLANAIVRAELHARYSPVRWLRAARSLGWLL